MEDDVMTLTKKRVSKKHYPPDTQAAKMLLDVIDGQSCDIKMSDEEIKAQIMRLIKEYEGELNEESKT